MTDADSRPTPVFDVGGVGTVVGHLRRGLGALNTVGDLFEELLREHALLDGAAVRSIDVILLYADHQGEASGRTSTRSGAYEARIALDMAELKAAGPDLWRVFARGVVPCLERAVEDCGLSAAAFQALQADLAQRLESHEGA